MHTTDTKQTIINLLKSKQLTVQAVKNAGFKLFINHYRYLIKGEDAFGQTLALKPLAELRQNLLQYHITARGGMTFAEIVDPETGYSITATANCSKQDVYIRRVGIEYALRRALRDLYDRLNHRDNSPNSE